MVPLLVTILPLLMVTPAPAAVAVGVIDPVVAIVRSPSARVVTGADEPLIVVGPGPA